MSLENQNNEAAQTIKKAFENWENESPKGDLWSKLSESLDTEFEKNHTPSDQEKSLSEAFNDWNADSPDESVWNKLDEDLSEASVWNRLEESLGSSAPGKDAWIVGAYNDWSANTNNDGWSKLDEALSRERVWTRLNISLTRPVLLTRSWLKYAASLTAFLFLSFFMNDEMKEENHFVTASKVTKDDGTAIVNNSNTPKQDIKQVDQIANNVDYGNKRNQNDPVENNVPVNQSNDLSNQATELNNTQEASNREISSNVIDETVLGHKGFTFGCTNDIIGLKFLPKARFSDWTIGFGTQLSLLSDDNRNPISTSLPRFGISAEAGFNRHFNHWGISESVGYNQFSQTNGNYINGRFLNSQQRLSVLQLNTSVFYSWRKFDINAGFAVTKLINGDELQNNKIVNVYYMSAIQAGLTGGVTYNISPIRNKIRFGVGAQYQWIPTITTGNSAFRDVQGIKIQAKISF